MYTIYIYPNILSQYVINLSVYTPFILKAILQLPPPPPVVKNGMVP